MIQELTLEQRFDGLLKSNDEIHQAYHNLAHMISEDRHQALRWKDCTEASCRGAREYIERFIKK